VKKKDILAEREVWTRRKRRRKIRKLFYEK